jgi:hypothetical protein
MGAMAKVIAIPKINRVLRGMPAELHKGAVAINPSMRANG